MKYRIIRIQNNIVPKRFFRKFYAREDLTLEQLGEVITTLIEGGGHYYVFRSKDTSYVPKSFLEESMFDDVFYGNVKYKDMPKSFTYEYDMGDGWTFNVNVNSKVYDLDSQAQAIFIEGKGAGIWEDNIMCFIEWTQGKYPKNFTLDEYEKLCESDDFNYDICFPENLSIESLDEWDDHVSFKKGDEIDVDDLIELRRECDDDR